MDASGRRYLLPHLGDGLRAGLELFYIFCFSYRYMFFIVLALREHVALIQIIPS